MRSWIEVYDHHLLCPPRQARQSQGGNKRPLTFSLNELGKKQSREIGKRLSSRPIAAIYSSPVLRCRQTAAIIQRYFPKIPIEYSDLVTEVRSKWQGEPYSLILNSSFEKYLKDNNEHPEKVAVRMLRFCEIVKRKHPGQEIICITHGGGPVWALQRKLKGLSLEQKPTSAISVGEIWKAGL